MKNLDPVYAVVGQNRIDYYSDKSVRDRVYNQLSVAGVKVATQDYKPGMLDRSNSGDIPGVRFGNPALQRGVKPGTYGG